MSAGYSAVKYEPPVKHPNLPGIRGTGEVWGGRAPEPVNFRRYTDIQNYWNHHAEFPEGMPVRVTEKIHGTNSRIALLKVDDEWNFHAGSHYTARRQFEPNGNESVYWRPLENEGVLAMLTHLCNIDTTHPGPNHRCWLENDAPTNDVILYGELTGRSPARTSITGFLRVKSDGGATTARSTAATSIGTGCTPRAFTSPFQWSP